jgi:hypothetical protein
MSKTKRFEIRLAEQEQENLKILSEEFNISNSEILRTGLQIIIRDAWQHESEGFINRVRIEIDKGMDLHNAIVCVNGNIRREKESKKNQNDEMLRESQLEINKANEKLLSTQDEMIKTLREIITTLEKQAKDQDKWMDKSLESLKETMTEEFKRINKE